VNAWKRPSSWFILATLALAGGAVTLFGDESWRETSFTILMYAVLASSLNLFQGFTGYVNFGHIAFFGLGGYTGFYLLSHFNWPFFLAAMASGAAVSLLACGLGWAILRLRGATFALATIGINEAARSFINNFPPFGGPTGLSLNFSAYARYGGASSALWLVFAVLLLSAMVIVLITIAVRHSRFGLGLLSIREDEDAAMSLGVHAPRFKLLAYGLSAFFPAVVGTLFFFKNGNVEPGDAFRLNTSIEIIVMIMLGGQGTIAGPLLGALGYERLRGLLLTSPLFKNLHVMIAGLVLLLIVLFVPAGAVGGLRQKFPRLRKVLE
jgi:branched-chain amino acid transport system permease protein